MKNNPREKWTPTHNLDEAKSLLEENNWVASYHNAIKPARDIFGLTEDGIKQVVLDLKKSEFKKSCIYPGRSKKEDWQDSYITNFEENYIYIKLRIVDQPGKRVIIVSFHDAD